MKTSIARPASQLELRMLEEADANGGHVTFDFANDLHYEYFLEKHGGEKRLRKVAPDILELVDRQRSGRLVPLDEESQLGVADFEDIRETRTDIQTNSDSADSGFFYRISGAPSASYTDSTDCIQINSSIIAIDPETHSSKVIYDNTETVSPDSNLVYSTVASTDVPAEGGGRNHAFRTTAHFLRPARAEDGGVCLKGGYAASVSYTVSSNADIQSITVVDPVQKHLAERKQHGDNYYDYICISYNRDWVMKNPDYNFTVDVPHGVKLMPVHLNLELVVKLRNDAYFYADDSGSYLYKDYDPKISLSRFDDSQQKPISGGEALLLQDWVNFSQKNISVEERNSQNQAISLRLKFPDDWKANLKSDVLLDASTYADFYSKITFNTCNKDSKGVYHKQPTSIFIMWLQNPPTPYNPTAPGINTIHTPRFYYQWGCLARDVELATPDGTKPACDVQIGDVLLSRGGKEVTVRDVQTGPQWEMVRIKTQLGSILLTKDHTVCAQNGHRPAGSVSPGDLLWGWDPGLKEETLVAAESVDWVVYDDTVYNFLFDEAVLIIGNNLLVGDYKLQQAVRNVPRMKPLMSSNEGNRIMAQLQALAGESALPAFVSSNEPESLALHYFVVKALAMHDGTLSEENAQAIAEYCQYAADNATTGGVTVGKITPELNESGLCTPCDQGFIVPIIPTAMESWYDDAELKKLKPWLLPPDVDQHDRKYNMIADVLAPFHFPRSSDKDPQVSFNSAPLQKLLGAIAEKARSGLDTSVKMAMGLGIHLLADSMLHERFAATRNWKNLGRIQKVFAPDGTEITEKYKPYRDFPFEEYKPDAEYPAGLQQISRVMHDGFARLDYIYPMNTGELPKDETGSIQYSGHRTPVNMTRYTRASKEIMRFLVNCMGKDFDETAWDKILAPIIETLFAQQCTSFKDLEAVWRAQFANAKFSYDAKALYERMVKGDPGKTDPLEAYDEFFRYTMLLYNIKTKGGPF